MTAPTPEPTARLASLEVQNVLGISLAEICFDPQAGLVVIGGENGAGKSSLLRAVAMLLGGARLGVDLPIRRGNMPDVLTEIADTSADEILEEAVEDTKRLAAGGRR